MIGFFGSCDSDRAVADVAVQTLWRRFNLRRRLERWGRFAILATQGPHVLSESTTMAPTPTISEQQNGCETSDRIVH